MLRLPSYNEPALLQGIARSDESAFTQLFNNYKDKIYSIALDLTKQPIIAEEIVQDVFVIIWNRRQQLKQIEHFSAYLFTITRNEVLSALKRNLRFKQQDQVQNESPDIHYREVEQWLTQKEYQELLNKAVERLPPQQQQVYRLIKEQQYKREEVANQMNLAPESVKAYLAQALRNIRAYCIAVLKQSIVLLLWLMQ